MSDSTPAGWQPDPTGRHGHRYWDGTAWTDNVADAGVSGTDPFTPTAAPDATVADTPTVSTAPPPAPDATAARSTTPAAPVGNGGGRSKKGLMIGGGLLALIAIAVGVLLLSGGDDNDDEVRTDLIGALTNPSLGDLSRADAACVADEVMGDIELDVLTEIDYTSNDVPDAVQIALIDAYEACGVVAGGGSEEPTSTTEGAVEEPTTTTEATPSDGGPTEGVISSEYLEQLATSLGLSREQAQCLADRLTEAFSSGEITEEQAATEYLDYFADCDISLGDVGAN